MNRSLAGGGLLAMATCALVLTIGVGGAAGSTASAARTITLNDTAQLHKISSHGFKLYEEGQATGTIGGKLYLHLTVNSTNHVTGEISVYPGNSSMTGTGSASYHVSGGKASFSGTLSITRGTGSYAHAHGTGLSFSGTIQRSNDAVSVHVSGKLST
jgi:hypothetical protein